MNKSTLVGTICYYPNNSDFYFFGFDTFVVKVPTPTYANKSQEDKNIEEGPRRNRDMVFEIICKLCGITEDSEQGLKLHTECENFYGIFIDTQKPGNNRSGKSFGILYGTTNYVKNIRYCLRLDTSRLPGSKPSLQFIKFSRKTVALSKTGSEYSLNLNRGVSELPTGSKMEGEDFEDIDICKLDSEPTKLSDDTLQTLLEHVDNVVLLHELTSLQFSGDIKNFGTRGKKTPEILINASKLRNEVQEASDAYKECLTKNATIPS